MAGMTESWAASGSRRLVASEIPGCRIRSSCRLQRARSSDPAKTESVSLDRRQNGGETKGERKRTTGDREGATNRRQGGSDQQATGRERENEREREATAEREGETDRGVGEREGVGGAKKRV